MRLPDHPPAGSFIAFLGLSQVASGDLVQVASHTKKMLDRGASQPIHIFDDATSETVEVDFRGSLQDVLARLQKSSRPAASDAVDKGPRGPGRPKLGVVGREITLLPRHWEWLDTQPGGASVTLRKFVEEARRTHAGKDRFRMAQEATYRFMITMAGNAAGFEEATRVLYSSAPARMKQFQALVRDWPRDIRDHAIALFKRTLALQKVQHSQTAQKADSALTQSE